MKDSTAMLKIYFRTTKLTENVQLFENICLLIILDFILSTSLSTRSLVLEELLMELCNSAKSHSSLLKIILAV